MTGETNSRGEEHRCKRCIKWFDSASSLFIIEKEPLMFARTSGSGGEASNFA